MSLYEFAVFIRGNYSYRGSTSIVSCDSGVALCAILEVIDRGNGGTRWPGLDATRTGSKTAWIVRKLSLPSAVFRVSGDPDAGRATFVALSKGQRTVVGGNPRNYRPETDEDVAEVQIGYRDPTVSDPAEVVQAEDVESTPVPFERALRSADPIPDPVPGADIAFLCQRLEEVVAVVADGTCSPLEAAVIVQAAGS